MGPARDAVAAGSGKGARSTDSLFAPRRQQRIPGAALARVLGRAARRALLGQVPLADQARVLLRVAAIHEADDVVEALSVERVLVGKRGAIELACGQRRPE